MRRISLLCVLAACSSSPYEPVVGVQLDGNAGDPAIDAFIDYTGDPASWDDVVGDVILTRASIRLRADATIGQVNEALEAANAGIVRMIPNLAWIVVHLEGVDDLPEHFDRVVELDQGNGVWYADAGMMGQSQQIPSDIAFDDEAIDHLIASRAPAAWNASEAFTNLPIIGIADRFGNGTPSSTYFDASLIPSHFGQRNIDPIDIKDHGYLVLSVIVGKHGGTGDAGKATGIIGKTVTVRAFDDLLPQPAEQSVIDWLSSQATVLNISQANVCANPNSNIEETQPCSEEHTRERAAGFAASIRSRGFEATSLIVVSAGNLSQADNIDSKRNSWAAAAALYSDLVESGVAVPPLTNVLVVEGLAGDCLWDDSARNGTIAAQATNIWGAGSADRASRQASGTSFAAPQVAGVAAMVWSVQPALSPTQVRDIIITSAKPGVSGSGANCDATTSAPVLDTYAAVLAADTSAMPVRRALINVNNNSTVDISDLTTLSTQISNTGVLNWSRHDLNGDGTTGGSGTTAFDLDGNGSLDSLLSGTGRTYDETQATDLDVLCYYAWSSLYEGDTDARNTLLASRCNVSACGPIQYRVDNGNGGTFDVAVNMHQSFALARLQDFTSGNAVLRLYGLCPNQSYNAAVRGTTTLVDTDPTATLTATLGTATMTVTQSKGFDVDVTGMGQVTTDSNGEITVTITSTGANPDETQHVFLQEINLTPP